MGKLFHLELSLFSLYSERVNNERSQQKEQKQTEDISSSRHAIVPRLFTVRQTSVKPQKTARRKSVQDEKNKSERLNPNLNCVHTMKLHCGESTPRASYGGKKFVLNYNTAGNVNMKQTLALAQ